MSELPRSIRLPSGDEFNRFLYRLYSMAVKAKIDEFRPEVFQLLDGLLKFDSAWWGTCLFKKKRMVVAQSSLYNLPAEFIDEYIRLIDKDPLVGIVDDLDGETIAYADLEENEAIDEFDLKYGLHYGMTCVKKDPVSGVGMFISVYRNETSSGFTEPERLLMHSIVEHLVQAWSINLRLALAVESSTDIPPACLIDSEGRLIEISHAFAEKLLVEFPDWDGGVLPPTLRKLFIDGKADLYSGKGINVWTAKRSGDHVRLQCGPVRRSVLTPREQAVASAFANGSSYKEIAAVLHLTPGTVRSYLAQCYAKLDVKNKIELGNALENK